MNPSYIQNNNFINNDINNLNHKSLSQYKVTIDNNNLIKKKLNIKNKLTLPTTK